MKITFSIDELNHFKHKLEDWFCELGAPSTSEGVTPLPLMGGGEQFSVEAWEMHTAQHNDARKRRDAFIKERREFLKKNPMPLLIKLEL